MRNRELEVMQNPPRQIRANCGAAPPAANLCTARERPRLPLRGLAFERRQWRMQRERQAAAVREREIAKPKRERRAAREQSWILLPLCGNKRLRERYTKAARKQYVQACTKVIGAASRLPCALCGAHSLPLGEGGAVRRSPHRDG